VRTEEKQIDGLDLELAERQHKASLGRDQDARTWTEGELPEFGGEAQRDIERARNTRLIDAMRQIMDSREGVSEKRSTADALKISELGLPEREAKALQALENAVRGRTEAGLFIYAEDRREMLEQALAVLQPNLTSGATTELAEIPMSMEELTASVGELREALGDLEDAQEELIGDEKQRFAEKHKPGKPSDPVDPDKPKPPSALTGGPEAKREEKPSTLSTGPEAKREETKSTLSEGPAVKDEAKASTLSAGPAVEDGPEAPSTLGDEKEIAEVQKKKPWWRRPFG
jgi:hypothetical protein